MNYEIKGSGLKAKIESMGAQLISLCDDAGREYIWQRTAPFWQNCAPILFPVVGRCENGTLSVNGKNYPMELCHGFAPVSEFELKEQSEHAVTLRLISNTDTRRRYPFAFILDVSYRLDEKGLSTLLTVTNPGKDKMLFGIGGHPGFCCEPLEEYEIDFGQELTLNSLIVDQSLYITPDTKRILDKERILPLRRDLFAGDALIFEEPPFDSVVLRSRRDGHGIEFSFQGFSSFAIWSQTEDAGFVCLEPWNSMGKRPKEGTELANKKGILSLEPGGVFSCQYNMKPLEVE